MQYKRILTVQDISCVGQCSLTVALPILSACGQETCVLPTAVLSTHTGGFGVPAVCPVENLTEMWHHWQAQGITFDAILTGYLGSVSAIETAAEIMDALLSADGVRIVDPAMADNGKLYAGFDENYVRAMGELCRKADVILPNITEAAMLSGLPYRETLTEEYVQKLLSGLNHKCTVLTGVGYTPSEMGIVLRENGQTRRYRHARMEKSYHGTGDIFAACFTGAWMGGKSKFESVKIAADFTRLCIENTQNAPAHWYGVRFETVLPALMEVLGQDGK